MHQPFPYRGDDAFDHQLKDLGCPFYVEEVRAFILGAVLSADALTPKEAMEYLLRDDEGEPLSFQNDCQYKEFSSQFFSLWNTIAEYESSDTVPPLSYLPSYFDTDEDRLHSAAVRANEIKLFLTSLGEGTDLESIGDEPTKDLLFYLENLADSLHQTVIRLNDNQDEEDLGLLASMMEDLDNAWQTTFLDLKETLLDHRQSLSKGSKCRLLKFDLNRKNSAEPVSSKTNL